MTTAEVVTLNPTLPAPGEALAAAPMAELFFDINAIRARIHLVKQFIAEAMILGVDYGTVPGTDRIGLFKPGAEKLAEFYGVIQRPRVTAQTERWEDPMFFHREYEMDLVSRRTGQVLGTGIGSCNSREARYRWRNAERTCPQCRAAAIIKGKPEYGGGFVCFARKGGCGAKYKADDAAILDQPIGRVENDDVATLHNTIIKMAKKRALVDGIVSITRSAGLLIEVAEEDDDGETGGGSAGRPPAGGKPGSGATGPDAESISDEQHAQIVKACEASGHSLEQLVAWAGRELGYTGGKLPRKLFIPVLKRASDKEPLAPQDDGDPFRQGGGS